jgi:hypothetical protein
MFLLTANIPQNWRELLLGVTGAGYEPTHIYVSPPSVGAAELKVFRTLTIRPGESIAMRVFLGWYVCGDESHLCRRIFLESPTGEPLDLEVIPADSQRDVGLFGGPLANHPFLIRSYSRRVTVSDREVWIYAAGAEPTEKIGVFDQLMTLVAHHNSLLQPGTGLHRPTVSDPPFDSVLGQRDRNGGSHACRCSVRAARVGVRFIANRAIDVSITSADAANANGTCSSYVVSRYGCRHGRDGRPPQRLAAPFRVRRRRLCQRTGVAV